MTETKQTAARQVHPIPPLFGADARVLILGSFPSVKSREGCFFYNHPQNRFWRVLAEVFEQPVPQTVDEKRELVLANRLALWDVIASCEISGSDDSSIRDVTANDLREILDAAPIEAIFINGGKAYSLYQRYCYPRLGREAVKLPSTSPANAAWSLERLCEAWRQIRL